jgi:hypothetical protein
MNDCVSLSFFLMIHIFMVRFLPYGGGEMGGVDRNSFESS